MSRIPLSIISFETFRRDGAEWRNFLLRLGGVLLIAGLVLLGLLEWVLSRTAETMDFNKAAQLQAQDKTIIWNSRDGKEARFKLIRLQQENPEIIAMGHSRMAQFRSAMFHPDSFYNFSRLAWNLNIYADLLERVTQVAKPRVVLFSLDFTSFNPAYTAERANSYPDFTVNPVRDHFEALYDAFMILYLHPDLLLAGRTDKMYHAPAIGMRSAYFSYGFRGDGSETQSRQAMAIFGYDPGLGNGVKFPQEPFYYAAKMGTYEMSQLERLAAIAHAHGIQLVGIQMPYYGPVLDRLESNPNFGILKDFQQHVSQGYFEKLGILFFDFSRFPPYSNDYRYFDDSVHTGEVVSAAVVRQMWMTSPRFHALLPNLDIKALDEKIREDQTAPRHVILYNNEF